MIVLGSFQQFTEGFEFLENFLVNYVESNREN